MKFLMVGRDQTYLRSLDEVIVRDCVPHGEVTIERMVSGGQALAKLKGDQFDVCFIDENQDGHSGIEILRAIENLGLRCACIFLATQANKTTAYAALQFGAMDYLIKADLDPFALVKSLAFSMFRKSREMELRGAALHDELTGLGNRTLFQEQARKLLQHAKRARDNAAVVFMDVDGLKPVNDTYGHVVGDQVLKEIATRLLKRIRESDVISRYGGDEFVALLGHVDDFHSATLVADNLASAIRLRPFHLGNLNVQVGLSCGTALFPEDSENIDDLIRMADQRMYEVKVHRKKEMAGNQMVWPR